MSTYDFSTQGGASVQVSLPVSAASTAFDSYRAEFSATRNFFSVALTKNSLTAGTSYVLLALTSNEVETLQDCRFRVIGTRSSVDYPLFEGGVDYTPAPHVVSSGGTSAVTTQAAYQAPIAIQNSATIDPAADVTAALYNNVVLDVSDLISTLTGLMNSLTGVGLPMAAPAQNDSGGGRF